MSRLLFEVVEKQTLTTFSVVIWSMQGLQTKKQDTSDRER